MKNFALDEAEKIVLDYRRFLKKTKCRYSDEPPYYCKTPKKGRAASAIALAVFAAAAAGYFVLIRFGL